MRRHRSRGFTLVELLIVIVIILILIGSVFLVMGRLFRGSALQRSHNIMVTSMMKVRQDAARRRRTHFLRFETAQQNVQSATSPLILTVQAYVDTNKNGVWDTADVKSGEAVSLPPGLEWVRKPDWIGILATGQAYYPAGYTWVQRNAYESAMAAQTSGFPPDTTGDLVIRLKAEGYRFYMDVDEGSAQLRKSHLFTGD